MKIKAIPGSKVSPVVRATLEDMVDAVVMIDANNAITFFNSAAVKLWGLPAGEALGKDFMSLISCEDRTARPIHGSERPDLDIDQLAGASNEVSIRRLDGTMSWGSMSVSKITTAGQADYIAVVKDTTIQRLQQEQFERLSWVVNQTDAAIIATDPDGRVVYSNGAATRMLGYELDELLGRRPSEVFFGPRTNVEAGMLIRNATEQPNSLCGFRQDILVYTKTRKPLWVSIVINAVRDEAGNPVNLIGVLTDITLTKMHEELQENVLGAMVREMPTEDVARILCQEVEHIAPNLMCSVIEVSSEGRLTTLAAPSLPPSVVQRFDGLPIGPSVGSSGTAAWREEAVLVADISNDPLWEDYRETFLPLGIKAGFSYPIKAKDGTLIGVFTFYYRERGGLDVFHERLIEVAVNLCILLLQRKSNRAHIYRLAFYDNLTRLPNRAMLTIKMEQALQDAKDTGSELAVVSIDLDRFKQVNDTRGHAVGDELLGEIARRLRAAVCDGDVVGRLCSDEFILIVPRSDTYRIAYLVQRILKEIRRPVAVKGSALHTSASVGIAMYPGDGTDVETLLRHANMAMYQSKADGRSRLRFFSVEMNSAVQEQAMLEADLRAALHDGQLYLRYQPKVCGEHSQILFGVEALVRWKHPLLGEVPPARFVTMAEERALIIELDTWVLSAACRQLAKWRRCGTDIRNVAINLSASHFLDAGLPGLIARTLRAHDLPPDSLTLELTEGVMLGATTAVLATIDRIHRLGVRLSMDDFGTGYSSLGYLHRLPIDELKLDKSFVQDLEGSDVARALTASVLRIGQSLHMKVVAEGVETEAQRRFLAQHGCPVMQGYLFSKPLSPAALEKWLKTRRIRQGQSIGITG
ncbi:sensor domain-containing protein [Paraburkholderia antibiotica]|uniref:EAL domain-containing protein n=1 Tax=Paraburkholderia antibiotica TaxID=2728839 RepID=A0A7Y0FFZ0_9BURK|nr:EAL domain-containing protein [Paraburkholderia antibiotica]NML34593.1 EAL domain-containing protein [Paraburkholderia antibiotica]